MYFIPFRRETSIEPVAETPGNSQLTFTLVCLEAFRQQQLIPRVVVLLQALPYDPY
jgi:hypothetical protein